MRLISILLITFISWSAFAGDGYGTCYVANGMAHALFCSKTSDSGSGTGSVTAYNQNGDEVYDDNIVIWIGQAIMGCEEVATEPVPASAVGCSFSLVN